jgi:hypothetical protein
MEHLQASIWKSQYESTKFQFDQEKKIANLLKLRKSRLAQQKLLQQLIRNAESKEPNELKLGLESMAA